MNMNMNVNRYVKFVELNDIKNRFTNDIMLPKRQIINQNESSVIEENKILPDIQEKRYLKLLENCKKALEEITETVAKSLHNIEVAAINLFETATKHIDEAKKQIKDIFSELETVEIITARPKEKDSMVSKLTSKLEKGRLPDTKYKSCVDAIGDAYGTRLQMQSISPEVSKKIIQTELKGLDVSYDDFVSYANGDTSRLSSQKIKMLDEVYEDVLDSLKESQTKEVFEKLVEAIKSNKMEVSELNNYGDELSAYFSRRQIDTIAELYNEMEQNFSLVTKQDLAKEATGLEVSLDNEKNYVDVDHASAVKKSGYTSAQMNIKHYFKDGTVGNGEFQIRGVKVNDFADAEHIPYDIKKGKITGKEKKYEDIYAIISKMSSEDFQKYNELYITQTYKSMRLQELGIPSEAPNIKDVFPNGEFSEKELDLLSVEGLVKIHNRK